ncbi:hypothetical protein E2542_SST28644 [Spatholobus suberectus]|nr:hypothetical protein E2542_SST28644 [Spatholobus suberectus]
MSLPAKQKLTRVVQLWELESSLINPFLAGKVLFGSGNFLCGFSGVLFEEYWAMYPSYMRIGVDTSFSG